MGRLECPYCGEELDDPEDCYDTGYLYKQECPYCEKTFIFEVEYERIYSASEAACLNGAEHEYKPTNTIPKECAVLRCVMCGDEKPMPRGWKK